MAGSITVASAMVVSVMIQTACTIWVPGAASAMADSVAAWVGPVVMSAALAAAAIADRADTSTP